MRKRKLFLLVVILFCGIVNPACLFASDSEQETVSTKKERNYITKGNKYYNEGKFQEAIKQYQLALEENPSSVIGKYNLGLSELKIGSNPNDTSQVAKKMLESGCKNMESVASIGIYRPDLASRANYNLGNVAFTQENYPQAVSYYKQALRLNPDDNDARRNLRIAQLKIQNQEQNDDQNQNQDQQEEQQQQDQDEDQNENQDQQDQQDQQNQEEQQQDNPQTDINQQTVEQILNAIENKENQTRNRVGNANAEKSRDRNRSKKNW